MQKTACQSGRQRKSRLKVLGSEIDPRRPIRATSMHGLSAIIASVTIWRKAAALILRSSAPGRCCRAIFSLSYRPVLSRSVALNETMIEVAFLLKRTVLGCATLLSAG